MEKNLAINMGNCHHRRYIPKLLRLIRTGSLDPSILLTQHEPLSSAIDAYKAFDRRQPGWVKVELEPSMT
jgi:threonine dehydrogenase-like Zn-dependent dehydrogenase